MKITQTKKAYPWDNEYEKNYEKETEGMYKKGCMNDRCG